LAGKLRVGQPSAKLLDNVSGKPKRHSGEEVERSDLTSERKGWAFGKTFIPARDLFAGARPKSSKMIIQEKKRTKPGQADENSISSKIPSQMGKYLLRGRALEISIYSGGVGGKEKEKRTAPRLSRKVKGRGRTFSCQSLKKGGNPGCLLIWIRRPSRQGEEKPRRKGESKKGRGGNGKIRTLRCGDRRAQVSLIGSRPAPAHRNGKGQMTGGGK